MRKSKNKFLNTLLLFLFTAFLLATFSSILSMKAKIDKSASNNSVKQPNYRGEKIIYDVMLGNLRLGRMRFSNIGNTLLNGRILNLMVTETKLTRFSDTERIYSDPKTLLPVKVERDILNIFTREKITEYYDQDNFTVTILKKKGAKQEHLTIKKDDFIHNAALLPYYVRHTPNLAVGRIIIANLPTRRLEIELVSEEEITVPAGTFKAYHFTSTPRQIDIWISADKRRIPLKIQSSGALGYSMVMKEYNF